MEFGTQGVAAPPRALFAGCRRAPTVASRPPRAAARPSSAAAAVGRRRGGRTAVTLNADATFESRGGGGASSERQKPPAPGYAGWDDDGGVQWPPR
jgi:hypothetical protein